MSGEKHINKPLAIGAAAAGVVAVGAVGWLAHTFRKGRRLPQSEQEAIEDFRDNNDGLYHLRAQVIAELFQNHPVEMRELFDRLVVISAPEPLPRQRFDKTMTTLRDVTPGHFAMVDVVDGQYQPSSYIQTQVEQGKFDPATEVYVSGNS
jgi:hypothetical protein